LAGPLGRNNLVKSTIVFLSAILLMSTGLYGVGGDMGKSTDPHSDGSSYYTYLIEDFADFEEFISDPNYWAEDIYTE